MGANVFARVASALCLGALGLALALPLAFPAAAETFPNRPIEVVIHSKYGGGTDTTARMMIIGAKQTLGVDMNVIAKRGGSGAKAHAYVNGKPRDGYTLMALTQSHLYTIARGKSVLKIDDLVGVARAMDDPTLVAVSARSPYGSLAELIAASKKKPLNWGVSQIGGTEHIGLARLAGEAGMKYKAVPFGSGAQMVLALMSGAVDAALPNISEATTRIRDGTMRPLAVLSDKALEEYPDIPTSFALGYKVKVSTTRGYAVLKGTPPGRIAALSKALVAGMKQKAFAKYLEGAGLTVDESVAGHTEWTAHIKAEYAAAAAALKDLGLVK